MTEAALKKVNELINTSVDDCRQSLQYIHDLDTLEALLREAVCRNHTSRAKAVMTRIRQLKKGRA